MKRLSLIITMLLLPTVMAVGAEEKAPGSASAPAVAKPRQFIYVLHLVPRLHDDTAWTEADKATVNRHFARLAAATKSGQVILAGRTAESGDKTFGIVIFEAADDAAARDFMNNDPCVTGNVMIADLHPYQVALQRK